MAKKRQECADASIRDKSSTYPYQPKDLASIWTTGSDYWTDDIRAEVSIKRGREGALSIHSGLELSRTLNAQRNLSKETSFVDLSS